MTRGRERRHTVERRRRVRRSADRRNGTTSSRALRGAGVALQMLGIKKGIELLQSNRQPPPPRQQRYGGAAGALLASVGVSAGVVYLAKSGRMKQIIERFRRPGTGDEVGDVVSASEVRSGDGEVLVPPPPPVPPVDPTGLRREPRGGIL